MFDNLLFIFIICFIITVIAAIYFRRPKDIPPGPFPWPVVGNLGLLKKLCKELGGQHKAFAELSKIYGSNIIRLHLGSSYVNIVSGYEAVQQILRNEEFDGRPWNEFIKIRNMGMRKGITMNDGSEWREMRAWLIRCLKSLGFGHETMTNKILEELKIILDKLKSHSGKVVCMRPIIAPAVINVIWGIAVGKRIDDEAKVQYFLNLMEKRAKAFDMAGGMLSIFPWVRHFAPKLSGYELLITLNKELKELLVESIEEHKKNYVQGKEMDLIDMFLAEMYHGKGPEAGFTEDQLLMILIDLFIAGLQTTAVTLDFLFLYMTVYQDIQTKLHHELDSVMDDYQFPQLSDRPKLPFTEAIISESQRLRLVVPIIGPRRVLQEKYIDGYRILKNTCVLMNIYSIHMDPENFDDPECFKPERFLKDDIYIPNKKLIFFGGGHRRCPGEVVAKSATFLLFTGIMQRYKLLPVPGCNLPDTDPIPGLTISPKPYEVLLVERSA